MTTLRPIIRHPVASWWLTAWRCRALVRPGLQLNLLAPTQLRAAPKLSGLRKSTPDSVWGCDLGGSGLKALQLQRDKASGDVEICDAVSMPHATPLAEAADDQAVTRCCGTRWHDLLDETRRQINHPIVLGFSGPRSLGRTFEIPNFKSKKAEEAIAYEAKMQIPIPADEIAYDWHAWPVTEQQSRVFNR